MENFQSARILVVDDDRSTLDFIVFHLENAGYQVFKADTGQQAMDIVGRERPEIILLDVYLPDEIGLELCSRIKSEPAFNDPSVLIMSAWAPRSEMAETLARGADDYIVKPINPQELLPMIKARIKARQAQQELRQQGRSLHLILDSIQEMMLYMDKGYNILWANRAAQDNIGKDFAQISGRTCHEILRSADTPCQDCPVQDTFVSGRPSSGRVSFNDGRYWYNNGYPMQDSAGGHAGVVLMSLDITQQEKSRQKCEYMAMYDSLTGLGNRNLFMDRLEHVLSQARRYGNFVGMLYLDLDGFKEINDRLGHAAGDEVLVETARRIKSCLRESDIPARLGGDEFAVILPQMKNPREAEEVAGKILEKWNPQFDTSAGKAVNMNISAGLAAFPEHGDTLDRLVNTADKAMYQAKKTKGPSFVWAGEIQ